MKIKVKPYIFALLFIVFCVFNIESVILGMRKALSICAYSIIPSLFIFTVISDITVSLFMRDANHDFSPQAVMFFLGALCGFPIGATVCEKLLCTGAISEKDAKKLLPFCNIASPAFVIGAVGISVYSDKNIGILLYFCSLATSLISILFIRCDRAKINSHIYNTFSEIFFSAVEKSIFSILKICALICIFTAILSMVDHTPLKFIAILTEVSCGCSLASTLFTTSPYLSIAICGFCIGFSGFCIHAQIVSVVKNAKIGYVKFFFKKLLQGVFCSALSVLGYYLFFCLNC